MNMNKESELLDDLLSPPKPINSLEACALLGFPATKGGIAYLSVLITYCPNFPEKFRIKGKRCQNFFNRSELTNWLASHSVKQALSAAYKKRSGEGETCPTQALRLAFLKGDFAPPDQQRRKAIKRLHAKHFNSSPVTRVTVGNF
ncbi:MAG: hypothetical protein Q8M20_17975 [Rhodocyclaceae bacterium]|nr:hypothetical protein [Rhodocyclaceae bacterium]